MLFLLFKLFLDTTFSPWHYLSLPTSFPPSCGYVGFLLSPVTSQHPFPLPAFRDVIPSWSPDKAPPVLTGIHGRQVSKTNTGRSSNEESRELPNTRNTKHHPEQGTHPSPAFLAVHILIPPLILINQYLPAVSLLLVQQRSL